MSYKLFSFNFRVDILSTLKFFNLVFSLFLFNLGVCILSSEAIENKTYAEKKQAKFERKRKAIILKNLKDGIKETSPLYPVLQDIVIDYFGPEEYIKSNESLLQAAKDGDFDMVKQLVENGADSNTKNINEKTSLYLAQVMYRELYDRISTIQGQKEAPKEEDIEKLDNYRKIIEFLAPSGKK